MSDLVCDHHTQESGPRCPVSCRVVLNPVGENVGMGRKAALLTYDRRPKLERTRSDFAGHTFRQYHHDEMVVIIDVICGGIARQTVSFTGNRSWPASPSDIDPGPPETS